MKNKNFILNVATLLNHTLVRVLDVLRPLVLLGGRFYIAWVFFSAGLTKIADWETTLFLFEIEYHVPFLSPHIAAYLGTFGELVFPVLVALGLFGRFGALGLFAVNIVAVYSLSGIAPAALALHWLWGTILAGIALIGPGAISLDRWFGIEK